MEETFRMEISDDQSIVLPKRLLTVLGRRTGDEVRFVTDKGKLKSVEVLERDQNCPVVVEDETTRERLEEIAAGKHEDEAELQEELSKPSEMVAW